MRGSSAVLAFWWLPRVPNVLLMPLESYQAMPKCKEGLAWGSQTHSVWLHVGPLDTWSPGPVWWELVLELLGKAVMLVANRNATRVSPT